MKPEMTYISISDEEAVMIVYRRILMEAQQGMCKKISKWWIKAIHPNKQTKNPYAKGDISAPYWWPPRPPPLASGEIPKGNAENGFCRHVEPDHLSKPGRELTNTVTCFIFLTEAREIEPSSAHPQSGHRSWSHAKAEFHHRHKARADH
jgi:hypothetical protein